MILASLVHCPLDFCDPKLCKLLFKCLQLGINCMYLVFHWALLVWVNSGLSNLNLIYSSFSCKALACFSVSIVKVTSIWVEPNIKSRSTQAQDPLNCLTSSTKFHLFPHLKLGISMYLFDMVNNIKGCFAWFDLDLMFGLTQIISHIKGLPTDRCQSTCHFHNGCWETSISAKKKIRKDKLAAW